MRRANSAVTRARLGLAVGLISLAAADAAIAQTSGTLRTQTAANWTVAPWAITAGTGSFPNAGGVATWETVTASTAGTLASGATITLDTPITLSQIVYNSPFSMTLAGSTTNTLVLPTSGTTLNATLSIANTPSLFQLANSLSAPISGGGSAGLTKTGTGTVTLSASAASPYTGGTKVNGGTLVASGASGDGVFGATGTGNGISIDGGTLFNNLTGGWTTSRDIAIGSGGGAIISNTAVTVNGVVSGPSTATFRPQGFGSGVIQTYTGVNTFGGTVSSAGSSISSITLSGNGSFASATAFDLAGTLTLTNSGTNVNDRIANSADLTTRGLTVAIGGNATAATSEVIGAVKLGNGTTIFTLTPNAAQPATLTASSFTRNNKSTLFVRGTSLGAASAANVAQVYASTAPTLVGGGGAAGSTNISIVPWAWGNVLAGNFSNANLITYGATGFRPLATTEYASAAGGSATDNVRLTAATVALPTATANALVYAPAAVGTVSGGTLTLTSGAFLYSPTVSGTSSTVSAGLNFGTAEGVVHISTGSAAGALTLSGPISGSGGLTLNSLSGTITISGASTYTGATTLNVGTITYNGSITNDGTPSAFGAGTSAASPIVFNPGSTTTRLWSGTAGATFDRDIIVNAGGPGTAAFGTAADTLLTVNGNITLNRQLNFEGGSTLANAMVVNGVISGPGLLSDNFSPFTVLNGANTYSGGTNIQTGTYLVGNNAAFGTGTIWFSGAGFIGTKDATARTIANPLFIAAAPTFQGAGALTFTGDLNLNGSRSFAITNTSADGVTFSGVVSNGALTKTGTGKLSLNSPTGNTYTGGTVLGGNAGTLAVNNTSGSGTGTGAVSIGTGSTLTGSFTLSGATVVNGTLSPGAGVGTANFQSSLTLSSTTTTQLELAGASSADKLNVIGLFTLGGTVNVVTVGGYVPQLGDSFDLIDWGNLQLSSFTVVGNLVLTGAPTAPDTSWDTSEFLTSGRITVVPEPASLGVLTALSGFGLVRRPRSRRR
jgi:autotransporter-associated beta strand protein